MVNWFDVPSESPNKDLTLKNLKVTENGTYGESGTAYSSVEVNVSGSGSGGGDFSTAEVTIIRTENPTSDYSFLSAITIGDDPGDIYPDTELVEAGVHNIVLYKGLFEISTNTDTFVSVSGNATYEIDEEYGDVMIRVTGDCSITINPQNVG